MKSLSWITILFTMNHSMCFGPVVQSCRRICETTLTLALANKKQHNSMDDLSDDTVILERQASCHRRSILVTASAIVTASAVTSLPTPPVAMARLESVNRPDLLPKESGLNVIQTEKFLTSGQARRMNDLLKALERDTGFRVRVLCQNYPNTPGLAIRDYWDLGKEGQKDDKYVVLVVDQFGGRGNVLNFNVGEGLKFALPNIFWTRLSGKYGTTFYVRENGVDLAVINAIEAIVSCLRNEDGYCTSPPDEGQSLKSLGL